MTVEGKRVVVTGARAGFVSGRDPSRYPGGSRPDVGGRANVVGHRTIAPSPVAHRCSPSRSPSTSSMRSPKRPSWASASWLGASASPRARPTAPARCWSAGGCSTGRLTGATGSGCASSSYGDLATARTAVGAQACRCWWSCATPSARPSSSACRPGPTSCTSSGSRACARLRYSTNARRSPIHRSSAGKVLAAFDPAMVEARLRAGLPPSTGYTIVVPEVLLAELARVRERGYAAQRRRDRARACRRWRCRSRRRRRAGGGGDLDGRPDGPRHRRPRGAPRGHPARRRPQRSPSRSAAATTHWASDGD